MQRQRNTYLGLLMIAVLGFGGVASAQPYDVTEPQVGISGATLFKSFFKAPASTNDYVDVDGDGIYGFDINRTPWTDQLATTWAGSYPMTTDLFVTYRGAGSGNGLAEMLSSQAVNVAGSTAQGWYPPSRTGANTNYAAYANIPTGAPSDLGVLNRYEFNTGGTGSANPIKQRAVDVAVMDVPTTWFITQSGTASYNANPTSAGYGNNAITSWDTTRANKLKSLTTTLTENGGTGTESVTFNLNTSSPDNKTIFDTQIAFVPMGIIANRGVASADRYTETMSSYSAITGGAMNDKVQAFEMTQLQQLFSTGRMPNGENLKAATRDSGSGTRNGTMNSIGVDPSWGRGDNLGNKTDSNDPCYLGADHQVTNLGGSSYMQLAVANDRLTVGYQGVETAEDKMSKGYVEHCAVMNDAQGGSSYVFPTIDNMVDNLSANTGWRIGGNETMATVGDPNATAVGTYASNGGQSMTNTDAAKYVRNITESIAAFSSDPSGSEDYFMPGEYMAQNFLLVKALQASPSATSGTTWVDQTSGTGDGSRNTALATYIKNNSLLGPGQAKEPRDYGTRDSQTPNRVAGSYDDGGTQSYVYYTNSTGSTATKAYKSAISDRNLTQGDFNNDELRNIDDLAKMIECLNYTPNSGDGTQNLTNGVLAWAVKDNNDRSIAHADGVMPHIIGDYDGNGNFDAEDIRYFCDGLSIQTNASDPQYGKIDKSAAYAAADTAGIFTTTKANGSFVNGDSMFDVAGSDPEAELLGATPGAAPNGHDGAIDGYDINYTQRILSGKIAELCGVAAPSRLRWSQLDEAIFMDLSIDFDGDMDNDTADLQALFDTLGTGHGDANLDGEVGVLDLDILGQNYGLEGYWAEGDLNGDGVVNVLDLDTLGGNYGNDYDGTSAGPVPEPATMCLLAVGGLTLLRRRRK
ncbi:MAG: PEP-CTERM sorting domain-containing protein [Phycisphaerae bacterium]|nr:PEP-CTERM sorting domain-containing protein [Phycisphaerae bacterium]